MANQWVSMFPDARPSFGVTWRSLARYTLMGTLGTPKDRFDYNIAVSGSSQGEDIAEYSQAAVYGHAVDQGGGFNRGLRIPRSLVPVHPGL